jgi:UDP-N-acetylmuramyl pentapeptide synthase
MRLQPIPLANGTVLVSDELKASAESVSAALETFAGVSAARRIVVLGDIDEPPGDARAVYRELGRQLARAADDVVLVGSHWLKTLRAEAVRSGIPRQSIRYV